MEKIDMGYDNEKNKENVNFARGCGICEGLEFLAFIGG